MSTSMTNQANALLGNLANAEIPAEFRELAEQTIAKSRNAYSLWAAGMLAGAGAMAEIAAITRTAAQKIGDKAAQQMAANTEVAFAAAAKIARAGTVADAVRMQAEFAQDRLGASSAQGKELLELTAKVAEEAVVAVNEATRTAAATVKLVA